MIEKLHQLAVALGPAWTMIVAAVAGAGGLGVVAGTIANIFRDPDRNPATPPPWWVQILDVLALIATKGHVGVMGRLSLPGVKSRKRKAPSGPRLPMAVLAILSIGIAGGGCSAAGRLAWKTAGIDAAKCLGAGIANAAGSALIDFMDHLRVADLSTYDAKALGSAIAVKYGPDAAICALGKIAADLLPALGIRGAPDARTKLIQALLATQDEWSKPAASQ